MKDEYLIWKRVEDDCKRMIENTESQLYINKAMLRLAKANILKLERAGKVPKLETNPRPVAKASPGN